MKIAIVIDPWKLATFERHLTAAGYTYSSGAGLTPEMLNLYIRTGDEDLERLKLVITAANNEAREKGKA